MNIIKRLYRKLTGAPSIYIDDYKLKIKRHLPANPVILEAGACDGKDTLQMSTLWPKASIHSFEPIPDLYRQAKQKLTGKTNVQFYPYALSDKTGQTKIYMSSGLSEGSSSLLAPMQHLEIHPDVKFETVLDVDTYTLDEWADKNKIKKIDFMWLDLQGAEFKVLNSSPRIFSSVKVLFTEVSLIETYQGVTLYPEFRKWLEQQGFKVVLEDLPYSDMGNVLFVRK